ncbi:DUF6807 domain-containing protein, partial [Thermobifida halotolerans]|uniref:DUF6807 domain-containing protein n=1 Tax=Thermobifida halotolerans TaxID=483545 RepID=UPI0018FEA1CF
MTSLPSSPSAATLSVDGVAVARHRDGADVEPVLSPRPYLHPVRTLGGTVVTEVCPDDHRHHLGVSVAVPDVSGVSFWGGRTFTRDRGSVLLDNHGRQEHLEWLVEEDSRRVEALSWTDPDGAELVREERTWAARRVGADAWALEVAVRLRNTSGRPLSIGSPATNGRPRAGYGGFFWRAPIAAEPPRCLGPGVEGEDALHGSRADWLALAGRSPEGREWTLVFVQDGPDRDPWFLRAAEYPGVGAALAWAERLPPP